MTPKQPAGSPEWTDPDDAPELTEAFFADAEIFAGGTFVRRARGPEIGGREGADQRAPGPRRAGQAS